MSEERKKGDAKERKKKSRQKKKERNDNLSVSEIITALVEENSQFKHVNKH